MALKNQLWTGNCRIVWAEQSKCTVFLQTGPSVLVRALTVMANGQGAAACKCTDRNASHGIWTVMIIRRDMDVLQLFYADVGTIRSRGLYVALHYQGWKRRVSC